MRGLFKKMLVSFLLLGATLEASTQSQITGAVTGLLTPDSAIVRVQKSNIEYFFVKIYGNSGGTSIPFNFSNLSNGSWALSIDAPGYSYPPATVVALNNNTQNRTIQISRSTGGNFLYQWQDDSSYVGHAQQSYINTPVQINVLGNAVPIPSDFNAINILNEYGFLLSNDSTTWTSEDAFRLYVMLGKLNFPRFGENDSVIVRAKWHITNRALERDINYTSQSGVNFVTVSRQAFTYANPLVVTVDGIKGKFFSKRLFNAVVFYYTDRGTNGGLINQIAQTRYGFDFLAPSPQLQTLMNETSTNFQEFTADEKLIVLSMFEEFPDAMQRQSHLKYLVRRINGMPNPTYPTASAVAWVTNENIEFMESAFSSQSIDFMQRLVLHEKAHFLWEHTFDSTTKADWATLGGWYLDPTQASGWSTTNTTEFVSAYAHLSNPNEDMAESISFYITNPDALRSRSMRKFEFIRDRIMQGTRYIAIINPNMTFQVYNLFPDYNYPGKIKRSQVEVLGAPTEDKTVILEIELNTMNNVFNGAEFAAARLTSSIGTFKDIQLNKINPEGSILRGQITLSKRAKSGYWTIPQIAIYDANRNMRLEKSTTFGILCFVDNPMEDVTPPLYVQNTLTLDSVGGKFVDFSGRLASEFCGACADTLPTIPALKVNFDIIEQNTINPDGRAYATVFFPTLDSVGPNNMQPYSQGIQISGPGIQNDFPDSLKKAQFYFPVPDYMPRGYYSISHLLMTDLALNTRMVLLDNDTASTNYFIPPRYVNQRALRDSVYFNTPYPDLKPPMLDLNDIEIRATPTNPTAPNGETLFEMWVWVKDTSDYPGHESGFATLYYTLRDPQGLERQISAEGNSVPGFWITPDSTTYGWHRYKVTTLLPIGSPPGLWGVSSIVVQDRARNKKYYSFVEFVRFDVEASTVMQATPFVQIIDGSVNANNVDSISVKIGCPSCINQTYRLRMYSNMGGAVPLFEGTMTADTIQLNTINLTGVNDGNLYATVFMLDSIRALIGTGRAQYLKDTQIPNVVVNRSAHSNLVDTIFIEANENITNNLEASDLSVTNGVISDISKINNKKFRVVINRSCADSLSVSLLPGALLDTVGNPNVETFFDAVDAIQPPKPSAIVNGSVSFCTGDSTTLEAQIPSNQNLVWKRNGVVISGATSPILVARNSGVYTAEVQGANGCTNSSDPINITVHGKPAVSISVASTSQCLSGNSFSFINNTIDTSSSISYHWSFGDGTASNALNATKAYIAAGSYNVKLVSQNVYGCLDSTTLQVVVSPMPSAGYTINNNAQCLTGNSFSFTNTSVIGSGALTQHQWSFGDGDALTSLNATKTYLAAGTYNVKLVSTSSDGCKDSTIQQVVVNPMPLAGYTINSNAQCLTGNSFSFTNTSVISSGTLIQHQWSFGDGGALTSLNATKTYTAAGTYNVKLVSTSNDGCKDSTTQQVVVNPMPSAGYTINNNAQCLSGNSFSFTNTSVIGSGTLTQHQWSFGDGGTLTNLNATKTYTAAGTYNVKLVSTSNDGCKDSTTQQVVVNPMPSAGYTINNNAQCLTGNSFSFTNTSVIGSGTLTQHQWSFGDGSALTSLNATKTYTAAGTYNVKLLSTSNNGCKDSLTQQVVVNAMPQSAFSVSSAMQCLAGNSFRFSNNSVIANGTLTSMWNFGNGITSTIQSPSISYASVGSYTVKLISTSNNGCKDSTVTNVRVDPSPMATLSVGPYRSIHPGLLTTISATISPSGNYQYAWYRDNSAIPNETSTILDSIGYRLWSGVYKMTIENPSPLLPCTYTSSEIVIGDSVSTKLFIYPSPNNGQFKVTYYSPVNSRYQVVITDSKGNVLYRRQHEIVNRYQLIDVNLTGASRGLYFLQIQDPVGRPLSSGKFVIQ